MKITFLGTGIYSLAIAMKIKSNIEVVMWSEDKNKPDELNNTKKLESIIKDVVIPNNISVTNDYQKALKDTNYIIIGTGNKYVENVCNNALPYYNKDIPVIILTKGMKNKRFISQIVENILNPKYLTIFSGPTFATDLIANTPCALTMASNLISINNEIKGLFNLNNLSFQNSTDIIGVQICGTYKNIIAIASGICDELYNSQSTRALLLTYTFNELKDILNEFNCNIDTILDYAGIGDFILTCTSTYSRNYNYGRLLVKNKDESINYLNNNTVEGYDSIKELNELLKEKNMNNTIINILDNIINNNTPIETLINIIKSQS
ncbi:MAG: hypothetical protein IJ574_04160 [Bacilli bacterium]|nr:hypothetical protein [Bacilli bacterium]